MRVEPFLPPQLWTTPGREALWNAMLSHSGAALPLAARGTAAMFVPTEPPAPQSWAISLLPERAPHLVVVVDSFPFRALFGAELTAGAVPDLPPALHAALVEGMVAAVRNVLPAGLTGEVQVLGFGSAGELAGRTEPAGLEWFAVSVAGIAQEPVELRVGCARDALLAALLALEPRARTAWSGLAGRLTGTGHFALGSLTLSRAELASLVPGALAVFPPAPADTATLRTGAALYRFARTEGGWQCRTREPVRQNRTRLQGSAMSTDDSRPPLLIEVDFDLGSVTVPIGEIESWQPGAVVPLAPPAPTRGLEVTIRINGQVVGSGDLVTIDERPAVRISRLALGA